MNKEQLRTAIRLGTFASLSHIAWLLQYIFWKLHVWLENFETYCLSKKTFAKRDYEIARSTNDN